MAWRAFRRSGKTSSSGYCLLMMRPVRERNSTLPSVTQASDRTPSHLISNSQSGSEKGWSSETASMGRSEEHTSELQSLAYLVCRLLLEKKKNTLHGLTLRRRALTAGRRGHLLRYRRHRAGQRALQGGMDHGTASLLHAVSAEPSRDRHL